MGTETSVPQRGPSRSPNVHRKPWNKASHRHRNGRCGQLRRLQAGRSQSSAVRKMGPSEPQPLQSWGAAQNQEITVRARGQSCGRDARTHVRHRAAPPLGRAPSHSALPGFRVSAALHLPRGTPTSPHPSHRTPLYPLRLLSGPARLTSLVESDTWKSRAPNTDPRPRLRLRTTSPRKLGDGHAHFRRSLPARVRASRTVALRAGSRR